MSSAYDQQVAPQPRAADPVQLAGEASPTHAPPAHHGGLLDEIAYLASSGLSAVEHAGARLVGGVNEQRGPSLNSYWNRMFGGPTSTHGVVIVRHHDAIHARPASASAAIATAT